MATLEMRELKGDDIFTLLGIVGKLGIKDEFMQLFEQNVESNVKVPQDHKPKEPTKAQKEKLEQEAQRRGMEAMAGLMQKTLLNAGVLKPDINALLSELTGESLDIIKNLGLKEYSGLIIQFFKKPELKDFFTSIASLLQ